jgi:hypothetical protein
MLAGAALCASGCRGPGRSVEVSAELHRKYVRQGFRLTELQAISLLGGGSRFGNRLGTVVAVTIAGRKHSIVWGMNRYRTWIPDDLEEIEVVVTAEHNYELRQAVRIPNDRSRGCLTIILLDGISCSWE